MSAPKHLWSGDWEREADDRTPPRPTYVQVTPEPPEDPDDGSGTFASRRTLIGVAGVVAVLVIVGVVLAFTLGGSSKQAQDSAQSQSAQAQSGGSALIPPIQSSPNTVPQQSTTPQVAPAQAQTVPQQPPQTIGPIYDWLGMELSDSGSGPTADTVAINSAADTAGVNPGDVIVQINGTQIGTMAQLNAAVAKLTVGQHFQLIVDRGSTAVTLSATLTGRPTKSP